MPDEATAADDGAAFRAAFIAENSGEPTEGASDDATASGSTEGDVADASDGTATDSADDSGAADDTNGADDAGDSDEAAPATIDLKAIESAIAAKDPELLLSALGDRADELLGTKAHKALSHRAKEIRQAREGLVKAGNELREKFGDPAAIRAAAGKGDVDTVISGVEKFFGAPWADFIKFVNAGLAGQPARLEAKARAENAAKTEAETRRQTAETQVRASIAETVKKSDAKLLAAHPAIVALVFEKMRVGFRKGLDTPAKALAAVKKDLQAQHSALAKVFTAEPRRRSPEIRPPREASGKNGREQTADEFRNEFVSQFAREQRASGKRGAQ